MGRPEQDKTKPLDFTTPMTPDQQLQYQLAAASLFGERKGALAEVSSLKNPDLLYDAMDLVAAVAIGLPVTRRMVEVETTRVDEETGALTIGKEMVSLITPTELMQIFMSPDFSADKSGAGYYAKLAIEQTLQGSAREDVINGDIGPGKYSREQAEVLVDAAIKKGQFAFEDRESLIDRVANSARPETIRVLNILRERAPYYEAQKNVWGAFAEYSQTSGDEKSGSQLFVTPGHSAPQGPDWAKFYDDGIVVYGKDGKPAKNDNGEVVHYWKRDRVLRYIRAAGMTFDDLVEQGKSDLLIPGLHYEGVGTIAFADAYDEKQVQSMEKGFDRRLKAAKTEIDRGVPEKSRKFKLRKLANGEEVLVKDYNIYAEGWSSGTFLAWFSKLEEAALGDVLAIYDAWYSAIPTGLVAEVATKGRKVGDPPIVSSLDAWLMHPWEKQMNEAGLNLDKTRFRWNIYMNKTTRSGIDRYKRSWLKPFFKNATIVLREEVADGDDERRSREVSVFDLWWKENRPLSSINWVSTDRPNDTPLTGGSSEVSLNSYDGWLYSKFQMYKMFEMYQGIPSLKDIASYGSWFGMGRSIDKAFGVHYMQLSGRDAEQSKGNREKADKEWNRNVQEAGIDRQTKALSSPRRVIKRDGVEFIQVVPDCENPRYDLLFTILARYAPTGALKPGILIDNPLSRNERFTTRSEWQTVTTPIDKKLLEFISPGTVFLEDFLYNYVLGGMLTVSEVYSVLTEIYLPEKVASIFETAPALKNMLNSEGIVKLK